MPVKRDVYTCKIAIIIHAVIKVTLEHEFPDLSIAEHDELFINVLDRLASLRGRSLKETRRDSGTDVSVR